VSARHQVKRLDRIFEELALGKIGSAEETDFLRSVRILVRNFTGASKPHVKSGPDVFADALVPLPALMALARRFPQIPNNCRSSSSAKADDRVRRGFSIQRLPPKIPGRWPTSAVQAGRLRQWLSLCQMAG
jgi:hypothetical protein